MIEGVADTMRVNHPDEAIVTVHDSLLVTEKMAASAIEIIGDCWRAYGATPKIKTA